MQGICGQIARALRLGMVATLLSITGCVSTAVEPVEPASVRLEEPDFVDVGPPRRPEPLPRPAAPPTLPEVAIVLTSRQAAYEEVAKELGGKLERFTIYDLSDRSQPAVTAFRQINDSDSAAVVAIGLRAAKSSVALATMPVVFSQVFNYEQNGLVTDSSRGISALAPLDAHLSAWKKVDPTLARVGVIIGDGHENLVEEAEVAADRHGVELRIQRARSDQETLYHFKRMIREIDGFWLFPDNRILSQRVLLDMLEQANRRHVPVAVSHEAMLPMGAAISMSSVASDIAATIVDVLHKINAGKIDDVPPLSSLSEVRVVTNDTLLKRQVSADAAAQGGGSQ